MRLLRLPLCLVVLLGLGGVPVCSAQATAYTVAAFPASATNPATSTSLAAPVTYTIAQLACNQAKVSETLPIANPYEGRFDDPATPTTRDCVLPIEPQFRALPVGSGYKAAYRPMTGTTPGPWSPFSSAFAVTAVQPHPCDGTPSTTGTVVAGARSITWCWNGLDTNGTATTVTSWAVTVDGVRAVLTGVVAGSTANAQGKRLYTAPLTVTAGTRALRVAGTNAVGEAVFSQTFTVTVTTVGAVPSVAEIRGVQ